MTSTTSKPAQVRPLLVTGDDNGLVKIWDLTQAQPTLNVTFGNQDRKRCVQALCWYDRDCTRVVASFADGSTQCLPTTQQAARDYPVIQVDRGEGVYAASSSSMAMIGGRLVMATKNNGIYVVNPDSNEGGDEEGGKSSSSNGVKMLLKPSNASRKVVDEEGFTKEIKPGPIEAVHIHRRYALVAAGGKNRELSVWDVSTKAERGETKLGNPLFTAENVDDHVLGVEYPTYVTGCCVVDYHVFVAVTAYHQVRFYDRRLSRKPVQEFTIDREIQNRRPTSVLQWNSNKYLIGEAGGDLHLYDTRRGFTSRAKLRGADGSVRCIAKHPDGLPVVATTGLDRVARIFHVPTGQQLQQMFLKQMGTCCLLSRGAPAQSLGNTLSNGAVADWQNSANRKAAPSSFSGWDEMMPVNDDLNEEGDLVPSVNDSDPAAAAEDDSKKKAAEVPLTGDEQKAITRKVRKEAIALAKEKQEKQEQQEATRRQRE